MRALALVVAAAGAVLVFVLATASANTDLFAEHYSLLLVVNGVLALALIYLVGRQVNHLRREYRHRVFGSRLKWRLLLMLAVMAVLPGALVYGVSIQFAVRSIDSWFDVRVDKALEGGLALGRDVLDSLQSGLLAKARDMSLDLGDADPPPMARLDRLREAAGADSATVLSVGGRVLAHSTGDRNAFLPSVPPPSQLRQARSSRGVAAVEGDPASGLSVRVLTPLGGGPGEEARVLQLIQAVPAGIARSAENVEAAYSDYQTLQLARQSLKQLFTLTLSLTLLLALVGAVALAFFLAERLARPLLILAEGTRAVAAGDFSPRETLASHDELGVLVKSFNRMTRLLSDARQETELHRAYLESVLANLSTGVLAFDKDLRLKASNIGAATILGGDFSGKEKITLGEWQRHLPLRDVILKGFEESGSDWEQQIELEDAQKVPRVLQLRGTMLPEAGGGGYVVVFDDITPIIAAQRSAAWGEVARRLAHEIKNPLTPIQLSAERLQMKLADKLDDESRALLQRGTSTIVSQVEAMKNMVNDFRDYARTPPPVLAAVDINGLVADTLALYDNAAVGVQFEPAADMPPALIDSTRIRQVLHNLVVNAQDAVGTADGARIVIRTGHDGRRVWFAVVDNGPGFPPEILARAFEPYVTSKARGTGLGLAIVKKIIDDHRGKVTVVNLEQGGTEVKVKLPVAA